MNMNIDNIYIKSSRAEFKKMLKEYSQNIFQTCSRGDAREESYYQHLSGLITDFSEANNYKNISVTTLPKKTDAGNPDFRVWDGRNRITGYIEAKDPKTADLDHIEKSDQLKRYRSTFPNLILTNFYEFRLFRNGDLIDTVNISKTKDIALDLKTKPPVENEDKLYALLNKFFSFTTPNVRNAQTLAHELAKRTRFLRDEVISVELGDGGQEGQKSIHGFFEAFKKYLIHNLTHEQFADLYAQTITYGLFAARTRSGAEFNRELAYKYIPHTIGILSDIFRFISLEEPSKPMQVMVDDIAEILNVTDIKSILSDYYSKGKGSDPILHFYETFLTEFDPEVREKRGVYYTPEPVVDFIVKSIHEILKSHFNMSDGLASEKITILDPAAGTLTFPAEAVKCAVNEYTSKYGEGGRSNFIKTHILKNYYALELMMAPYAIGHLKMSFVFEELGYTLKEDERFKLYLTNTLEMEDYEQVQIPGLSSLSEESHLAGIVKKEEPILVILGNPPYSGMSANINEWTEKLLKEDYDGAQSYYSVDGRPLGEKNPKWIQDDYVKFLRFAQWKIQKAGQGIVGMITNHSYLDNPTFRGMRQSLMNTFDEIYILNLHGNSLKKETAPDGGKDENVFDIMQGVAIAVFIKHNNKKECKVFYNELYGLRENKYEWLNKKSIKNSKYKRITPETPWYFFIPRDTEKIKGYLKWKRIDEIFPVNSVGIVTSRDEFIIDYKKDDLKKRILQLRNTSLPDELIAETFNLKDKSNWKLTEARKQIQKLSNWDDYFKDILYRPFDIRTIYYHKGVIERMRDDVMRHMLKENIALCFMRQYSGNDQYSHFFITENIVDNRTFFSSKGIIQLAPLYLYPEEHSHQKDFQTMMLFEPAKSYDAIKRIVNISPEVLEQLENAYEKRPTPEQILYYIYAVFYSNKYREKYAEFLKIDFPRVPFTSDVNLFKSLSKLGKGLAELHLLKSSALSKPVSKFKGKGENIRIDKVKYNAEEERVYINSDKYFDSIQSHVWEYQIGGYQVLEKYLKDRKGRLMDDPRHYCCVVTAIEKTIVIQNEIDGLYNQVEKKLIV